MDVWTRTPVCKSEGNMRTFLLSWFYALDTEMPKEDTRLCTRRNL